MSRLYRVAGGFLIVALSFFSTLYVIDTLELLGGVVTVTEATYGSNCAGVQPGNVTSYFANTCRGLSSCRPKVDVSKIGDPAPGCGKEFTAKFTCSESVVRTVTIPREANGKIAEFDCSNAR